MTSSGVFLAPRVAVESTPEALQVAEQEFGHAHDAAFWDDFVGVDVSGPHLFAAF
jgi:hypothetical protein